VLLQVCRHGEQHVHRVQLRLLVQADRVQDWEGQLGCCVAAQVQPGLLAGVQLRPYRALSTGCGGVGVGGMTLDGDGVLRAVAQQPLLALR